MTNHRDPRKEHVEVTHHTSDKHIRNEREAREARENADTMKQTLTWLIPLLLLLSIGYYLYRRAYTPTDLNTAKTAATTAPVSTASTTPTTAASTTPAAGTAR